MSESNFVRSASVDQRSMVKSTVAVFAAPFMLIAKPVNLSLTFWAVTGAANTTPNMDTANTNRNRKA